ncbi:hypothetical protein FDJ25_gp173 [Vibrio phage Aphrodite1]|uniref:Uncharacterized protein n=1 Tax=Vibrio phage Aphrodite1 TaxID=2070057 RepID=A0A2I7QHP6_9CAUD|nr:hypothetical protein FDJ25_gp173 [Vibrio phage Aphrodite1]AUR80912.1 hypothetical protein Aphrodite1_0027 [Vibrio phage Aphrodite1]
MKHIRQILLDKTALIRISYAESQGDPAEIALAKSRFDGLMDDEVQFLSIKERYEGAGTFIGEIKLTGRDGFEFVQEWSPGDTVPVLSKKERIKVPNLEVFRNIVIPGLYYVEDIAELCLVVKESMSILDIQKLLGFEFDPGELEVRLSHLKVQSPIVDGTLPLKTVTPNPDGTMTDGTGINITDSSVEGNILPANPYAPTQYITVERVGSEPVMSAEIDKAFKAEFVGTYRQGEIIEGTLGEDNTFNLDLDLKNQQTDDLQMIVSVGLDRDKLTDVYSVTYIDEHWTIGEVTTPVELTRVGHPFRIAGHVVGDFGRTPWGDELHEPKIIIEEVDQEPVVVQFDTNGMFDIQHTPVVAGDMTIKFVCGLPQDLNVFSETHQILTALSVDDLVLGPLTADKTEVRADELVTLTSTLRSSDGLTLTDTPVDFIVDDQVTSQLFASPEGVLEHIYDVENDTLDPVTYAVKLRLGADESNVITITVQPSDQVPGRFEIINDQGELFKEGELRFRIYDTVDRPMVGTSGTWFREGGAPKAYAVDGEEYVATLDSPVDVENTVVESITLKCQSLETPVDFTWNLVRRFDEVFLEPDNPTTGVTDDTITLTGKTLDQIDDPVGNVPLVFKTDGLKVSDITSNELGVFSVEVSETDEAEHLYSFIGENDIGASLAVTWAKVHQLTSIDLTSPTTVSLFTDETFQVTGRLLDQYSENLVGETVTLEFPDGYTEQQVTTESGFSFTATYRDNGSLSHTINVKAGEFTTPINVNWEVKSEPIIANLTVVPNTVDIGEDYTVTGEIEVNYPHDWSSTRVAITNDAGETTNVTCATDGTFTYTGTASAQGTHQISADAVDVVTPEETITLTVREPRVPTAINVLNLPESANTFEGQTATITGNVLDQESEVIDTEVTATLDGTPLTNTAVEPGTFSFDATHDGVGTAVMTISAGDVTRDVTITWRAVTYEFTNVKMLEESVLQGEAFGFQGTLFSEGGGNVAGKTIEALDSSNNPLTTVVTEPDGSYSGTYTSNTPGALAVKFRYGTVESGQYTVIIREIMVPTTVSINTDPKTSDINQSVTFAGLVKDQKGNIMVGVLAELKEGDTVLASQETLFNGRFSIDHTETDAGVKTYTVKVGDVTHDIQVTWVDPNLVTAINQIAPIDNDVVAGEELSVTVEMLNSSGGVVSSKEPTFTYTGVATPTQTGNVFTITETEAATATLTVSADGVDLPIELTWVAPPAVYSTIEVVSGETTGTTGETVPVKIVTKDQNGDPMPNQAVTWNTGGAPFPVSFTDGNGELTFSFSSEDEGAVTYNFSGGGGVTGTSHTITWSDPAPVYSAIELVSGGTSGEVGTPVEVVIRTVDQNGEVMGGQNVVWNTGGIPFPQQTSDAQGLLTFNLNADEAGDVTYNFLGGGNVTKLSHTITWSEPTPVYTGIDVQHGNLDVAAGETVTFTITTLDQNGQPMDQEQVVMYDGNMTWPARTSNLEGVVVFEFTEAEAKSVTYAFLGGDDRKEYTVTWS